MWREFSNMKPQFLKNKKKYTYLIKRVALKIATCILSAQAAYHSHYHRKF